MSEVAFHTGVDDPTFYACRLLRKAYRSGARAAVYGTREQLRELDAALWTFDPGEFIPHLYAAAGRALPRGAERTPIWLIDEPHDGAPVDLAVNLGRPEPVQAERYGRLIEIVSAEPAERDAGRARWKHYEASGHKLLHHPQTPVQG